jgi:putative permease
MKRFALFVVVVFSVILALVLTWRLFQIILMFVASLALAATLRSPIERLMDRGIPRVVAIIAVYLAVILGAFGLLVVLYQRLGNELASLPEDLGFLYRGLATQFDIVGRFGPSTFTPFPTPEQMTELLTGGALANAAQPLMGFTQNLATVAANLGLVLILSVYWTADRLRFERLALSLVPVGNRGQVRNIWRAVETGLGRYMRGEFLQSLVAGLLLAPVFALMGVQYPTFWALAAALAWLVPLVGAFIVIVPMWLVVWLQSGALTATLAVVITLVVLGALEFLLERRLYKRDRGTNILLLVVILIMANASGLLGLLLAPPIAIAIHIILTELANPESVVVVSPQVNTTADVESLERELRQVRALMTGTENGASRRLENLADRLDDLLKEAKRVADA